MPPDDANADQSWDLTASLPGASYKEREYIRQRLCGVVGSVAFYGSVAGLTAGTAGVGTVPAVVAGVVIGAAVDKGCNRILRSALRETLKNEFQASQSGDQADGG